MLGALVLWLGSRRNRRADDAFRHLISDFLGSVGVVAAAVLAQFNGWTIADPLVSIGIAALIAAAVLGGNARASRSLTACQGRLPTLLVSIGIAALIAASSREVYKGAWSRKASSFKPCHYGGNARAGFLSTSPAPYERLQGALTWVAHMPGTERLEDVPTGIVTLIHDVHAWRQHFGC